MLAKRGAFGAAADAAAGSGQQGQLRLGAACALLKLLRVSQLQIEVRLIEALAPHPAPRTPHAARRTSHPSPLTPRPSPSHPYSLSMTPSPTPYAYPLPRST